MKTNLRKFEILISVLQTIFGAVIIFILIETILDYYAVLYSHPFFSKKDVLLLSFRKNYMLFIVAFTSIISGIMLFKSQLIGWILSTVSWCMFSILTVISYFSIIHNHNKMLEIKDIIFICFLVLLFTTGIIILTSKEFREKYNPNKSNSILIIGIVSILTIAKFLYS